MKGRLQLTTWELECPYCQSKQVEVRQMGYFVNTLFLFCACGRWANFKGPEVIWTKRLQDEKVRTNFKPDPW